MSIIIWAVLSFWKSQRDFLQGVENRVVKPVLDQKPHIAQFYPKWAGRFKKTKTLSPQSLQKQRAGWSRSCPSARTQTWICLRQLFVSSVVCWAPTTSQEINSFWTKLWVIAALAQVEGWKWKASTYIRSVLPFPERSRVQADASLQHAIKDPILRRQHWEGYGPPASVDHGQHAGRGHQHSAGISRAEPPHTGAAVPGQDAREA